MNPILTTATAAGSTVVVAPLPPRIEGESARQRERRAAAMLVKHHIGPGTEIAHEQSGRPVLTNSELHISISHSQHYIAIAYGPQREVGIDIEEYRPQLSRVAARVLSEAELKVYGSSIHDLAVAWTMKEALYKAAGTEGADFRSDLHLPLDGTKKASAISPDRARFRSFEISLCTTVGGDSDELPHAVVTVVEIIP